MSLQSKVLSLKLQAAIAARHAAFWQRAIEIHGERKATAFYTHLGLNHLEKKSIEWEGLTLSREPKDHEKLCVKGIAGAQETSREQVTKILLALRTKLISDGLKGIKKLPVSQYHELTLQASSDIRESLRDRLIRAHRLGRLLVIAELSKTKDALLNPPDDEFELLDDLVDLTNSRIANDVQSRIIAAAARYRLLGLQDAALWKAVEDEIRLGSVSYIDRAATGLANSVINIGRSDEAASIGYQSAEYSAILDSSVCDPCASADGETATNESEITPAPNPDCAGGDWCRCFHVFIAEGNM